MQSVIPLASEPRASYNGKAVCLFSGGIDSPVAAWFAIRSGIHPVFAYFHNAPFGSEAAKKIAVEAASRLVRHVRIDAPMYIVPHGQDLTEIADKAPIRLSCVISRRLMFRVARLLATIEGCDAIVTGDSLGQKASQTIQNLAVTDESAGDLTVIRPLLGMNKHELERVARKIGTFEISILPGVASCGIPARNPRTHTRMEELQAAEKALNLDSMAEASLKVAERIRLRAG